MFISKSGSKVFHDAENLILGNTEIRSQWLTIFWFISPLFLSKIARASFRFSLISSLGVWIALAAISHFMIMDFPPGILQGYIELPWPIN